MAKEKKAPPQYATMDFGGVIDDVMEQPAPALPPLPTEVAAAAAIVQHQAPVARPAAPKPPVPLPVIPDGWTREVSFSINLPEILIDQIKREAFEQKVSQKTIILKGLVKLGFEVPKVIIQDRRKIKRSGRA